MKRQRTWGASGSTYTAQLSALNNSGASGTATVTYLGNGQLRVDISSSGLLGGNHEWVVEQVTPQGMPRMLPAVQGASVPERYR